MKINKSMIYTLIILCIGLGTYIVYTMYINLGPRQAHYWTVNTTQLDQERIGNLSLNQSISDLKPTPTADRNNSLFDYYTWKDGTKIATNLNSDKIVRIWVSEGSSLSTSKGIQVGESKEKIIHTYGNNYYKRLEQGFDIIGYVDKKLNRTLEFWLSQEKIYSIRLDIGSMD